MLAIGDRDLYARTLFEIAETLRSAGGRLLPHASGMANASKIRRRIESILDESRPVSRRLTKAGWASVLAVAVPLVYGAAAVQFEQAPTPVQSGQARTQAEAPPLSTPGGYLDSASEASKLTPAEAQSIERYLLTNPEDLAARGKLITHYYLNGIREPRLNHIFWLIEHHPESDLAAFTSAEISPVNSVLNNQTDYARARELWLQQTDKHAGNARVLGNAARMFELFEPETAERLLKHARQIDPRGREGVGRVTELYTYALASRIQGPPTSTALDDFALRLKTELENSTDGRILLGVGLNLSSLPRKRESFLQQNPGLQAEYDALMELGKTLLKRAEQFGAFGPASRAVTGPNLAQSARQQIAPLPGPPQPPPPQSGAGLPGAPQPPPPASVAPLPGGPPQAPQPESVAPPSGPLLRIRVGGNVQAAKLTRHVTAEYPAVAKEARIQGTVRMEVIIAPDGKVANLTLKGGHPLLVPAAQEAVRQWEYRPTLLNGVPVEVLTQVDVDFQLSTNEPGNAEAAAAH